MLKHEAEQAVAGISVALLKLGALQADVQEILAAMATAAERAGFPLHPRILDTMAGFGPPAFTDQDRIVSGGRAGTVIGMPDLLSGSTDWIYDVEYDDGSPGSPESANQSEMELEQ